MTVAATTDEAPVVDLSDDETFRAGFPHERFAWLREHDPVHWHEPTAADAGRRGVLGRQPPRRREHRAARRRDVLVRPGRHPPARRDGDQGRAHGRHDAQPDRRSAAPAACGPSSTAASRRGRSAGSPTSCVGAAPGCSTTPATEPFDFVHGFARELPSQAICLVLGVPPQDQPELIDWLDAGIEADSPSILSADTMRRIRGYAVGLIADKRAHPDAGIMSTIVHARADDGAGLSDEELIAFFALLFPAGAETTRSALAGAVKAFVDHPERVRPAAGRSGAASRRRSRRSSAGRRRRSTSGGRRAATSSWPACRSPPATRSRSGRCRPTATSGSSPTRSASTSAAPPTPTSASAGAPTSASAPAWPGWRSGSRSSCCSNGAPGSRPPVRRRGCRTTGCSG